VDKTPYPELPARDWMGIVESLARLRRIDLVSLEGGEPLLRADLPAILEACLGCARKVKVVTGGAVPLDTLPPDLLRHPRFFLELSMDGPREVHDLLRDGSFNRAREFLRAALERQIPIHLRSVISRINLPFIEEWLCRLDAELEPSGQRVGFSFDTLLFPQAMGKEGGTLQRARVSRYPAQGLLPSPQEMARLFTSLKSRAFARIRIPQGEPLRGCGFAGGGGISFDPAGFFSFCCEASRGLGWIHHSSAEHCLALLDAAVRSRPCRACPYFVQDLCRGCWTGQKCGMVEYWGAGDCQTLHRWMVPGREMAVSNSPHPSELIATP
jgi:MoaA/NifB/PqqE/SkfB family radical SAM enzyme